MALLDRVLDRAQPVPADAAWFEANYVQHREDVRNLLLWLCEGNQHRAEEVEHLVAIQAWLKGRHSPQRNGNTLGWLQALAKDTMHNLLKSEKRQPVSLAPETIELEHDQAYEALPELDAPFERFGHLLTDQELRVATLLFVRGLKQAEAGAALGMGQSGVANAIHRIKEKISTSKEGSDILRRSSCHISRSARQFSDDESKNYVNLRRNESEPADLRDEWDGEAFPVVVRKL